MNYTRKQALEAFLDYRKYHELSDELHESEIEFLNAKFPPIEVGNWYKSENGSLIRATSEALEEGYVFAGYGIDLGGEWDFSERWFTKFFTPATDQEVLDRLTEEAKKRYKLGDRVRNVVGNEMRIGKEEDEPISEFINGYFAYEGVFVLNPSTGEWAEVIESNPIHDKIEKLERELAELKQLINQ